MTITGSYELRPSDFRVQSQARDEFVNSTVRWIHGWPGRALAVLGGVLLVDRLVNGGSLWAITLPLLALGTHVIRLVGLLIVTINARKLTPAQRRVRFTLGEDELSVLDETGVGLHVPWASFDLWVRKEDRAFLRFGTGTLLHLPRGAWPEDARWEEVMAMVAARVPKHLDRRRKRK